MSFCESLTKNIIGTIFCRRVSLLAWSAWCLRTVIPLSVLASQVQAQQSSPKSGIRPPAADSLERILIGTLTDTSRVNLLIELARALWASNIEESRKYATEALTLADLIEYKKGCANAFNTIGVTYYYQGWYDIALNYHTRSAILGLEKSSLKML
jgi:hypothetical protein